jgi:hypothetical protein
VFDNTASGTIDNNSFIGNDGTLTNAGFIGNDGTLTNTDTLNNTGTINNNQTGQINNTGTLNNNGTINDYDCSDGVNGPINGNPVNTLPCPTSTGTITATFTPTSTPTHTPSVTACALTATAPNLVSPAHRAHVTDTTPAFSWSNSSGATSYRLMIYTADRSFEYKKRTFNTSYTLTAGEALAVGTYQWRVRTQDTICTTWTTWSKRNTLFVD